MEYTADSLEYFALLNEAKKPKSSNDAKSVRLAILKCVRRDPSARRGAAAVADHVDSVTGVDLKLSLFAACP